MQQDPQGSASQWLKICWPSCALLEYGCSHDRRTVFKLIITVHVPVMHTISCFSHELSQEQVNVCPCCRLSQLRELGLLPQGNPSREDAKAACPSPAADSSSRPGVSSGLKMDHSEAASSASGPSPPWPTPAQLKQTLAAFGRAQAEENAHTLAAR